MKKILTFIFGCIPINRLKIFLLRSLGHSISYKAYIGFSVLLVKKIELEKHSKIKHFNFLKLNSIILKEESFIGSFNIIKGPIDVLLNIRAGISKQNKMVRANSPITYGGSQLELGVNSIIVSSHFLDLTKSINIGENSIIAGINSQLWTHGYYHASTGQERIRIDGGINIGNNVYVGSGCIFNPGVKVANAIHIGAGSVISKNLDLSGMYVSQSLRHIENNIEMVKSKLNKVSNIDLIEPVYKKE